MCPVNKSCILKCNAHWLPIDFTTPAKAFSDMAAGTAIGVDVSYVKTENGEWDYNNPISTNPVSWDKWIELPIQEYDMAIHTVNRKIRVPRVVISKKFDKVPLVRPRLTRNSILLRDDYTCAYTGDVFDAKSAKKYLNIDHVLPKSKGGLTTWSNIVTARKDINSLKADKTVEEAGLKLIKKPSIPKPRIIALTELFSKRAIDPMWLWIIPKHILEQ